MGPAARLDSSRNMEQVTGNKFIHYMIQINPLMVPKFNDMHKRRANRALWQGEPVPGGGDVNERGTMYPFDDLPDIALSRAD